MDPGDADREELESRVDELERKLSKMLPERRDVLKGLGAAAVGGAAVGGATGGASGQSGPAGQQGTPENPNDMYAWNLDVANEVVTDLPMGGNDIEDAGSVNVATSLTDPAGVTHTGELADIDDVSAGSGSPIPAIEDIGDQPQDLIDGLGVITGQEAWTDPLISGYISDDYVDNAYLSGIYTATDEVVLVPFDEPRWGVYDPQSRQFVYGPSISESLPAFAGGEIDSQGRVIAAPHQSANVGIFDPADHSYTSGPAHGQPGAAFAGAVMGPDERIYMIPRAADNIGIFDPSDDTYSDGDTHGYTGPGTALGDDPNYFQGGTLAPNGDVVMAPSGTDNIGLYDPATDTYSDGPTHDETGERRFVGAVLMANGEVLLVPYDADNIVLYDYETDTATTGPAHNQGNQAFVGGQLLPTGEVLLVPEAASNFALYNPDTDSYRDLQPHNQGTQAYRGGALCPNGQYVAVPATADISILQMNSSFTTDSDAICLHPVIQAL